MHKDAHGNARVYGSHGNYAGRSEKVFSGGARLCDARGNYAGRTDKDGRQYDSRVNVLRRVIQ